jgi:uncharacterized membrane protein/3-hydroxymyristoyl/3-hydroxydecanoyl-(acyl carrier protein) dehydratase
MKALQILFGIGYPVLIYLALSAIGPRFTALLVLGLLVLRIGLADRDLLTRYAQIFWLPMAAIATVSLVAMVSNDPLTLLITPSLISLALLGVFGLSLVRGPAIIERFARLQVDWLSDPEVDYCRRVTWIWCGFFVLNGSIAFGLAIAGSLSAWALYTGVVGYGLMGTLFASEYVYRHWRFRRYLGAFTDPVLRRLFPPPSSPLSPLTSRPPPRDLLVGTRPPLRPQQLRVRQGDDRCEQDLRVPEHLACWPGHFPDLFILPGVLQVQWVMDAIGQFTQRVPELRCIEALKFKRPLYPGNPFTLVLEANRDRDRFSFRIEEAGEIYSSGRILLVAAGARA